MAVNQSVEVFYDGERISPAVLRVARAIDSLYSFSLAAASVLSLALNAVFVDSFSVTRLVPVLIILNCLHLIRHQKVIFGREAILYFVFLMYMVIQLLWTSDVRLAMNTLIPALDFVLILVLFASLIAYHNTKAVLSGFVAGFMSGAFVYSYATGFPFVYPEDFSYNAVALMYLFGLFVILLLSCYVKQKKVLLVLAIACLMHLVATTSIKTNLGVVLGVTAAGLVYFRHVLRLMWQNFIVLVLLVGVLGYFVATNDSLRESVSRGASRVVLGLEILGAREDRPGYGGFEDRGTWREFGLTGWKRNPIFGHGVESFRSIVGTTSHSTPVDLLFNSGVIGALLFYFVLASLAWRLLLVRHSCPMNVHLLLLSTLVCFLFITLSGTMHYSSFLGAFIAISVALLTRRIRPVSTSVRSSMRIDS